MNQSKFFFNLLFLIFALVIPAGSQESPSQEKKTVIYSFLVNKVPDGFNFPLVGFLNFADGSHAGTQIGFFNRNRRDFNGLQLSFINLAGGDVTGCQSGFINAAGGSFSGAQLGFINATGGNFNGIISGFFNAAGGSAKGIQTGFVNAIGGNTKGVQLAFVNANGNSLKGLQAGFVNMARTIKGLQLGYVNFTDSVEKGFPLGFLSFVRKGGYQALELSVSESFPVNLTFKTGIKALYTSLIASWNPNYTEHYALGLGIGSIIRLSPTVFFNPELTAQVTYPDYYEIYGLTTQLGFALNKRLHFSLGPSLIWLNTDIGEYFYDPLFYFYEYPVDDHNKIVMGARISLKYIFSK
jgi:hypothetical protein